MQLGIGIGPNATIVRIIDESEWPAYSRSGQDWRIVKEFNQTSTATARSRTVVTLPSAAVPVVARVLSARQTRFDAQIANVGTSNIAIVPANASAVGQGIIVLPGASIPCGPATDDYWCIGTPNQTGLVAVVESYWANGRFEEMSTKTFFSITLSSTVAAQQILPANPARKSYLFQNLPTNVGSFAECDPTATAFNQGIAYAPGEGDQRELDAPIYGIASTTSVVVNGYEVT